MNLSKYRKVFCDSSEAIDWAYKNGLHKDAVVKSGSPYLLWNDDKNIKNIESTWSVDRANNFKSSILKLTEDIFEASIDVNGVERELALAISKTVLHFHRKFLYKASCLTEDDFNSDVLYIYVNGRSGPVGNIMNSPWKKLLSTNSSFHEIEYTLKNDNWDVLTTDGVSYWSRFKIAGYKTAVYRLATKIMEKLPRKAFTREVIVPNENELNIEILSSLVVMGVRVRKINLNAPTSVDSQPDDARINDIYNAVLPIMRKKVKQWTTPSAVDVCMLLFKDHVKGQINKFNLLANWYDLSIQKDNNIKQVVLINAPGNVKGYALSYICRKKNIPFLSSQHGVTVEISKAHSMYNVMFDSSTSDAMFCYNRKIVDIESDTKFSKSKYHVVGMPMRLIGMNRNKFIRKSGYSIVYISTNLYQMGFSISSKTDYMNAKDEQSIVDNVLSKLPHEVCYKAYPADNRRYADIDPILNDINKYKNIKTFEKKIDMRYLISEHDVFVTTGATSTIAWPVMSGKPVVFINNKHKSPLTDDAYKSFSKGIFVFDRDDQFFHEKLREFLSQPKDTVKTLWKSKKYDREKMIRKYFSEYGKGAGSRAAKIIINEYLQ